MSEDAGSPSEKNKAKNHSSDVTSPPSGFEKSIEKFMQRVSSIHRMVPVLAMALGEFRKTINVDLEKFINQNATDKEVDPSGEIRRYRVPPKHFRTHRWLKHTALDVSQTLDEVPGTFVVAMVSQYDAFVGRLLLEIFRCQPDILKSSQRELTYEQLVAFSSIEAARQHLAAKEAESVLRQSHPEQFDWLEKRLGIPLRKDLDVWPSFVEVTQRRHLLVHADGAVSEQYLSMCRTHKSHLAPIPDIGSALKVDPQYFQHAYETLTEIAVKIGHVIWRKVLPQEAAKADSSMNEICFELLVQREYKLAKTLLSFALKMPRVERATALMFRINLAQSYKWMDDTKNCEKLLREVDWKPLGETYRLANAVLTDDFESAFSLMKRIGTSGDISKTSYYHWPLFRKLRQDDRFASTFAEIFNEPFEESGGDEASGTNKLNTEKSAASVPESVKTASGHSDPQLLTDARDLKHL